MVLENRSFKFNEFLRLRADHHAQYEIRVYDIMLDTLKRWVPITYEAFMDYRVVLKFHRKAKSSSTIDKWRKS